jgi:hypothetical protein
MPKAIPQIVGVAASIGIGYAFGGWTMVGKELVFKGGLTGLLAAGVGGAVASALTAAVYGLPQTPR